MLLHPDATASFECYDSPPCYTFDGYDRNDRTMTHPDPVTPWVADFVARRDNYRCIAPAVDGQAGWCRDQQGFVITHWPTNHLDPTKVTLAHVKDEDGQAMGMRAKSDQHHLLVLCWGHHLGNGVTGQGGAIWATSRVNLERQRHYLNQFRPPDPEGRRRR